MSDVDYTEVELIEEYEEDEVETKETDNSSNTEAPTPPPRPEPDVLLNELLVKHKTALTYIKNRTTQKFGEVEHKLTAIFTHDWIPTNDENSRENKVRALRNIIWEEYRYKQVQHIYRYIGENSHSSMVTVSFSGGWTNIFKTFEILNPYCIPSMDIICSGISKALSISGMPASHNHRIIFGITIDGRSMNLIDWYPLIHTIIFRSDTILSILDESPRYDETILNTIYTLIDMCIVSYIDRTNFIDPIFIDNSISKKSIVDLDQVFQYSRIIKAKITESLAAYYAAMCFHKIPNSLHISPRGLVDYFMEHMSNIEDSIATNTYASLCVMTEEKSLKAIGAIREVGTGLKNDYVRLGIQMGSMITNMLSELGFVCSGDRWILKKVIIPTHFIHNDNLYTINKENPFQIDNLQIEIRNFIELTLMHGNYLNITAAGYHPNVSHSVCIGDRKHDIKQLTEPFRSGTVNSTTIMDLKEYIQSVIETLYIINFDSSYTNAIDMCHKMDKTLYNVNRSLSTSELINKYCEAGYFSKSISTTLSTDEVDDDIEVEDTSTFLEKI